MMNRRRWIGSGLAIAALGTALVAWLAQHDESGPPLRAFTTADYLPGLAADLFLPDRARRAPVVVLVPGGSWIHADRSGLRPLASDFAGHGIVAATTTYRAAADGVRFPVPVADILCAVDSVVQRTRNAGIVPDRVLLLGHSAGAQLAALAALAGSRFRADCPAPPARIDGLIGLAGPYDIMSFQAAAQSLFDHSAAEEPGAWHAADAVTWVRHRPGLPVLLAHGADDTTVSPTFTTSFADRLRAAGHPVRLEIVPGADHGSIYRPGVIGDRVIAWITALR